MGSAVPKQMPDRQVLLVIAIRVWITLVLFLKPEGDASGASHSPPLEHEVELWPSDTTPPHDVVITEELRQLLYPAEPMRSSNPTAERPMVHTYLLPGKTAPAVLVFPGGGYGMISKREGAAMCKFANENGLHAILVNYRVQRQHPAPFLDARRAMQLVRSRASEWGIDPEHIGVVGFSAGGHLAGHLAVSGHSELTREVDQQLGDEISKQSARPDFAALAYPVVSASAGFGRAGNLPKAGELVPPYGLLPCLKYSCCGDCKPGDERPLRHHGSIEVLLGSQRNHLQAQAEVGLEMLVSNYANRALLVDALLESSSNRLGIPPFFIWHGNDDMVVPAINSVILANALLEAGVPTELHLFERAGPHGLGLARPEDIAIAVAKDPHAVVGKAAREWPALFMKWFQARAA